MLGKNVKASIRIDGYKEPEHIEWPVIFENKHFITVQTKNYPVSINKYKLITGECRMKVLS